MKHLIILLALLAVCNPMEAADGVVGSATPATEPTVQAVQKVLPAVVNINTERIVRRAVQDPYDLFFREFFGGPARPQRELRQKVQSLGSGFLIDPAGYIVTNEHVVERAADLKIQVTMADGKTYSARYISGDPEVDLALIKIESDKPLPFISLDALSENLLGQTVLAIGNPLGYGIAVSRGILSANHRSITIGEVEYKNLVQTDAAINPGNSGGPLIDLSGNLVGVNSMKMAYSPQGVPTQGLGFAIPGRTVSDKVAYFIRIAKGEEPSGPERSAARRLFGFDAQDLTEELTEAFGYAPESGVLITDVEAGSPAGVAGFRRGLVIYKVGRYAINSVAELQDYLSKARRGDAADFQIGVIRRGGNGRLVQEVQVVTLNAR